MKRIGIVGAGAIAQAYLEAFAGAGFGRIAAIADVRPEAAEAAAEAARCQAYASHASMLDSVALDGVILCTPPNTRPDLARAFLERRIPVMCEKPLAIDVSGAHAIRDAARASGTLVTMASKFRHVEDVIKLRSIITSGLLGDVRLLENSFVSPVDMASRWNSDPTISGGGVLIDNGTHSVDIVRYLAGPIAEVLAVNETCAPGLAVEDNALLLARLRGGGSVRVDLSWSLDKELPNFISVYGTQGVAHVGWRQSKYKQKSSSDWTVFGSGYDKVAAFRSNIRNFCAAIDGTEKLLIDIADALASVRVIEAAYKSARTSAWVKVAGDRDAIAPAGTRPMEAAE